MAEAEAWADCGEPGDEEAAEAVACETDTGADPKHVGFVDKTGKGNPGATVERLNGRTV